MQYGLRNVGLWSTNEDDALSIIDRELKEFSDDYIRKHPDTMVSVLYTWDSTSGSIDQWHKYCQKQKRDSFEMLNETLIFSNNQTHKEDYASRKT